MKLFSEKVAGKIWDGTTEPSFSQRIGAAMFILAMGGPQHVGVGTVAELMWPHIPYVTPEGKLELHCGDIEGNVRRTIALVLSSVHTAQIAALPPERILLASRRLAEYLSFSCGDGSLCDTSPSPVDEAPPQG